MTKFDYSQKPWWQFCYESTREALEDSRMKISDVSAIVLTCMESCDGYSEHQTHKISLISDLFKKKFLAYLKQAYRKGELTFVGNTADLREQNKFQALW